MDGSAEFKLLDESIVQDRLGAGLFRSKAVGGKLASRQSRRFSALSFKPNVTFKLPSDHDEVTTIAQRQARQSILSKDERISLYTKRRSNVSQYNAKPERRHTTIVQHQDEVNANYCRFW